VAALGSRRRLDNHKSRPRKLEALEGACYADGVGLPLSPGGPHWMARTARGRAAQLARLRQAEAALRQRLADNQARRACGRAPASRRRLWGGTKRGSTGRCTRRKCRATWTASWCWATGSSRRPATPARWRLWWAPTGTTSAGG
jgi:hypothetical protein